MSNYTEETLKEGIKSIFEVITKENSEQIADNHDYTVKKIIHGLGKDNISDPKQFYYLIKSPIEDVLDSIINASITESDIYKSGKIKFIFLHYEFFTSHLESVIEAKEGRFASSDKSKWLIYQYIQYIKDEIPLNMHKDKNCYWKPGFGSSEDWIDFMQSIELLYYGDASNYTKSVLNLALNK